MIIENYDDAVLDVLNTYSENFDNITLVEYGRGNGELVKYFLEKDKKVTVIEDFTQTIFQADRTKYKDYDDNLLEYNVLSSEAPEHKTDLIFCSLPHTVPHVQDEIFQQKLNIAFKNLYAMLNSNGWLVTLDYNVPTIESAIHSLGVAVDPLLQIDEDSYYMASALCEK